MSRPILLIDDTLTQIKIITRMLEKKGYTIHSYQDRDEALEGIREYNPAVVLCDFIMPGENGVEFCKRLKGQKIFEDGFFIIITDSVRWDEFRDDFHDLPDGWIAKTLPEEEFVQHVEKWYSMVP